MGPIRHGRATIATLAATNMDWPVDRSSWRLVYKSQAHRPRFRNSDLLPKIANTPFMFEERNL